MTRSEHIDVLLERLHRFQKRIAPLAKSATATKNGDTFTYAPIDDVLKHIRKPLARQGLFLLQTVTGDIGVTTCLWHVSGQWVADTAVVAVKGSMEDRGAAITQLRRYALITLLGLPTVDAPKEQSEVEKLLVDYSTAERTVIVKRGLWHLGYIEERPVAGNETRGVPVR